MSQVPDYSLVASDANDYLRARPVEPWYLVGALLSIAARHGATLDELKAAIDRSAATAINPEG